MKWLFNCIFRVMGLSYFMSLISTLFYSKVNILSISGGLVLVLAGSIHVATFLIPYFTTICMMRTPRWQITPKIKPPNVSCNTKISILKTLYFVVWVCWIKGIWCFPFSTRDQGIVCDYLCTSLLRKHLTGTKWHLNYSKNTFSSTW